MTPDTALANMRAAAKELLTAAMPGSELTESPPKDIPCGGLGGNEWSSISYSYSMGAGTTDDGGAVLDQAEAALSGLNLNNEGRLDYPAGPALVFTGEGFRAELLAHREGGVTVRGSTDCLDNPDR